MLLTLALLLSISIPNSGVLSAAEGALHVPSPEWRDQIIYFLVTDRFYDGDSSNNDQGAGEYDPADPSKYSGGDLEGIKKKIPYIKELGATAIWILPVVSNQWWDPWTNFSGYHGYWATNFMEVDKHLGSLETYKELSSELHKNGIYLIQDIVCNHTGNFFRYKGEYSASDPAKNFELNLGARPVQKPTQYPFNFNDARNARDRAMNVYHWTPDISDYKDKGQKLTYQMSGLDDLNTSNRLVRDALKESYKFWIREAGVDGYRMDTATYVDHDFWNDFLNSGKKSGNGIIPYAKGFGKEDFIVFAETWVNADHNSPKADIEAARFFGTKEKPEFNSVINFSLQNYIEKVFGRGEPTSYLAYRIRGLGHYPSPYRLLNFVDNHDMGRFLASYRKDNFVQALAFIMTIPGIPVIYYGSEQGFTSVRGSMFPKGFDSGGRDHFRTGSELFRLIKSLANIRKGNDVFRRGDIEVLQDSKAGAGVFAYSMSKGDKKALVIFNTSSERMLLHSMDTGLAQGTVMKSLFSYNARSKDLVVGDHGRISMTLEPLSTRILLSSKEKRTPATISTIIINNLVSGVRLEKNYLLSGTAMGLDAGDELMLIVNGNLEDAVTARLMENKSWTVEIPVSSLANGAHWLAVVAPGEDGGIKGMSPNYNINVYKPFIKIAEYKDTIGDDKGPNGNYRYPTHETFKRGQMDIDKVTLYSSGNNMKISIKMAAPISTVWNPKNGFDHVVFNIYIALPDGHGSQDMPFQNSTIKDGMKWDHMIFLAGWNNAIYRSEGSGPKSYGTPTAPTPEVSVDHRSRTIDIFVPAKSLGFPKQIKGSKIYITTWDYDGMEVKYRPLSAEPAPFVFGGAHETAPLIMDDTQIMYMK